MNYLLGAVVIVILAIFGFIFFKNQPNLSISSTSSPTNPKPTFSDSLNLDNQQDINQQLQVNLNSNPSSTPTPTQEATSQQLPSKPTKALLRTNKGDIIIALYPDDAPATVENFAKKALSGFYKNLSFHRVEDWVVQGGDPKGNGQGGSVMPTELNKKPFITGSLGVARRDDIRISNDAQFFITKQDSPGLNEQYTNFGIVTDGMDVVQKIEIGDKILEVVVR